MNKWLDINNTNHLIILKWLTEQQICREHHKRREPAPAETLKEEARDQPKNTTVNVEYPPRSNDETLDDEARRRKCRRPRNCHSCRGQPQPSAAPPLSTSLSDALYDNPLRTEEIAAAIAKSTREHIDFEATG
jgi:hypothetical protein